MSIKLGIIGYPLSHTLSPLLHRFFLEQFQIEGAYEAWEISPDGLGNFLSSLPNSGIRGFNVTIPHKTAILTHLDLLSDTARLVGAVNTVVLRYNALLGDNTDVAGFLAPLASEQQQALAGSTVLILGAGGASRAVVCGLLQLGVAEIVFQVRNPDRARETLDTAERMNQVIQQGACRITYTTMLTPDQLAASAMVVNTTPVGMGDLKDQSPLLPDQLAQLPTNCLVYDLIYNPLETRLLKEAHQQGLPVQDGLDMLISQGAEAFTRWTGAIMNSRILHSARLKLEGAFQ